MKKCQVDEIEESKKRWEFIEQASKEVDGWSVSKKAEVHPRKFYSEDEPIEMSVSRNTNKLDFK